MALLFSVLEQGLIYSIMALGMYITYKILDFPDMTVDGSFPMGSAIACILIIKGTNPVLTLPLCFLAGVLAGLLTGLIHVKLKVRDLLSGIIMMTALYSVNLRIAGRANLPIYDKNTIFENSFVNNIFPEELEAVTTLVLIAAISVLTKCLLDWYLDTKSGFLLRAVGDNDAIVTSLGVDKGLVKITGLSIANGLVALSGCIFAQQQRFFDISVGTGTAVIGLASVIIGTSLYQRKNLGKVTGKGVTAGVLLGAVVYKGCVAAAVSMGLSASDLKLITAALFLAILVLGGEKKRGGKNHAGIKRDYQAL